MDERLVLGCGETGESGVGTGDDGSTAVSLGWRYLDGGLRFAVAVVVVVVVVISVKRSRLAAGWLWIGCRSMTMQANGACLGMWEATWALQVLYRSDQSTHTIGRYRVRPATVCTFAALRCALCQGSGPGYAGPRKSGYLSLADACGPLDFC
ncbi:hypothetical protein B0T17DRAFT_508306 [Bombardia bombarda]|uniref:Uncharacterized protein n=1 Tax=Bombardia bombarda TaxID=252184 RepID=A0AA39X114_9PEZI|nr:hypothetical protein B0T17DRAFT_508306 [Bombardia bombarda]